MIGETAHRETHFEKYVISKLKAQGWKEGHTKHYDIEHALYPEDLVAWLAATRCLSSIRSREDTPKRSAARQTTLSSNSLT